LEKYAMKTREESHRIGFLDGQRCGDKMVQTHDINELLERLRDTKLAYEDVYYKDFFKSEDELKALGIDHQAYKEGFCEGCRDIITVGNEEKELGVGD
jgi:hypothetical protein